MNNSDPIEQQLRKELAAIEHERWSDWQAWCHKILRENCPSPELEKVLERWDKQIATPYSKLSESEQASDMEQVDRYWPLIDTYAARRAGLGDSDSQELIATIARAMGVSKHTGAMETVRRLIEEWGARRADAARLEEVNRFGDEFGRWSDEWRFDPSQIKSYCQGRIAELNHKEPKV